jgi:hypothetical protein
MSKYRETERKTRYMQANTIEKIKIKEKVRESDLKNYHKQQQQ